MAIALNHGLKEKRCTLRLNTNDFFENEETGLQIAIIHPGVQAVILTWRGKGYSN